MKARRIVIELLGSRIALVRYDARSGRRLEWRVVPIPATLGAAPGAGPRMRDGNPSRSPTDGSPAVGPGNGRLSDDAAAWVREVRQLGAVIRPVVVEMGAAGDPALVLYRSPTQAVELAEFDPRSMRFQHDACEAAKLAVFDSVTYSSMSAVCEAAVLRRDRPQRGDAARPRMLHIVVAADREDVAGAIVHMVEEAGLQFEGATPMEAAVSAHLVTSCLARDEDRRALLHIGEHSSLFLYVSDGAIRFSRRVNLGAASLATALGRPVRLDASPEPVQLPPDAALDVLYGPFGGGLADRTALVHPPLGLHGFDLLPLIQPMLQRSIVEIRQSLRFGVPADGNPVSNPGEGEAATGGVRLHCTGPGSAIRGLPELIAAELEIAVDRDPRMQDFQYDEPGVAGSELADAADPRGVRWCAELNLQPAQRAHEGRMKRVRRLLWTGAAAAIAVIAFDAFRFSTRAHEARQTADALVSRAANDEALRLTAHRLISAMEHMHRLEGLIDQETGARVDFSAAMHELSRITPASIRYTNVSFRHGRNGVEGTLSGFAAQPSPTTQATELRTLVEALRGSPLFESVVLGNVQYASMDDGPGERFMATVIALPAPAPRLADAAGASASAAEGGTP